MGEVADTAREGDRVRVASQTESWVKSTDRIVARAAQENGGIYDPVHHQSALEAVRQRQPLRGPDTPSPADLATANVRRLEASSDGDRNMGYKGHFDFHSHFEALSVVPWKS